MSFLTFQGETVGKRESKRIGEEMMMGQEDKVQGRTWHVCLTVKRGPRTSPNLRFPFPRTLRLRISRHVDTSSLHLTRVPSCLTNLHPRIFFFISWIPSPTGQRFFWRIKCGPHWTQPMNIRHVIRQDLNGWQWLWLSMAGLQKERDEGIFEGFGCRTRQQVMTWTSMKATLLLAPRVRNPAIPLAHFSKLLTG